MQNTKILATLFILLVFSTGCINTGNGTTRDTVHSIEYSGLLCKTWKVWLTHDMPTESNEGIYSINPEYDSEIVPIIKDARERGKEIEFEYHTELFTFGCFDEKHSGYAIIDSVRIVE